MIFITNKIKFIVRTINEKAKSRIKLLGLAFLLPYSLRKRGVKEAFW
ncbi:hypothetical protein AAULH_07106 [Lactobacillus helveticus MTCC 5463]|nr:hypothetical protein AAULH_07106 [Lactobacillus helveticus MTCC 5463]